PHDGGGWKSVYRVENSEELFKAHEETEQLVMMLQEEIVFDDYFRVYCLGQKYVHIMPYDPRKPFHERYNSEIKATGETSKKLLKTVHDYTLKLNQALGYDFNTVEFAVRDGVPYAIDFCNPAPDADIHSVGQENFNWIVEHSAKYAIEKAKAHKPKQNNTSWGGFVRNAVASPVKKAGNVNLKTAAEAKKTAVKSTVAKKSAPKAGASKKPAAPKKSTVASKDAPPKKTPAKKTTAVKKTPSKSKPMPKK
ncbi:MAG: hypothetical protein WA810_04970, partial [Maribacter sp.]